MQNIFIDILPPWVETGLQPAFYDLESGTVLQQTARMYAKVRQLTEAFNTFSLNVTNEINTFEQNTNDEIKRFENATNDEIERFEGVVNDTVDEYIQKFNQLHDYVENYFDNLDVQEEINNKLDEMVEDGTFDTLLANYLVICGGNAKQLGCAGDGVTDDTSAINTAISELKSLGVNKIVFPSGTYVVSGQITVPTDFEVIGMKNSIIKYVGEGTTGHIFDIQGSDSENPIANVTMSNVTISGAGQVYKGGYDMDSPAVTDTNPMYKGLIAIYTKFGKNITIENCTIDDVYGDGIVLQYCYNCKVRENNLNDVSSGNITSGGQTGYDNHGDGIVAFSSFNIDINNNTVINKRVYQAGEAGAIGKPCGRSGLEFEYAINRDYEDSDPDDENHNAPESSLIETITVGDKDYRFQYGCIARNNFVRGYTKGIHIESQVKCTIENNTFISNHIGVMYSTDAGGVISGNTINPMGIGQAPQSGYDGYYSGIAISQYGASNTRYGVIVTSNVLEGDGHGVTVGCDKVTITNNIFKTEYGVYTILANLKDICVSNNTFNDKYITTPNNQIYLYNVKSALVQGNTFYSESGLTDNISGDNITFIDNNFENVTLYHNGGGKNIVFKDNTFRGLKVSDGYVVHLSTANNNLVDSNTFYLDSATYDSVHAIKTYGAVNTTTFSNNRFYVSTTRGNKPLINSDNVNFCKYLNNACVGGTDNIILISVYVSRQCVYENNKVDAELGKVVNGTNFRGWNKVEKNVGVFYSAGYYPNNSLGELANLHYNKSDRFYKFDINSSSTTFGWVCTAGGYYVTTSWSSGDIAVGTFVKNSSDKVYKCTVKGSGNSTVEPTQTSGTQAEADGYTWKYLGAVATFKDMNI